MSWFTRAVYWFGILLTLAFFCATGWVLHARGLLFPSRVLPTTKKFPTGIVIHHTVTPPLVRGRPVDVAFIDRLHAARGFGITDTDGTVYHIGYHFLIQQDGTVLRGRPAHLPGGHAKGHPDMLGIALIGDFQSTHNLGRYGPSSPPKAQLDATILLTKTLMAQYHLTPKDVYMHRDLRSTACPGNCFPRKVFYAAIAAPENARRTRHARR